MRSLMIDDELVLAENRVTLSLAMLRIDDLMYQKALTDLGKMHDAQKARYLDQLAEASEARTNARLLHLCRTGKAYGEDQ